MAIQDVRALRSLKMSESKGDKGTVQHSATEEFLIIADAKDPPFADILADESEWPNLGNNPLPRINDELTASGITFIVNSRELAHYKDNERAVVMTVRYDAKPDPYEEETPENTDPVTWQRITIQTQQVTKPALGWEQLGDVPGPDDDDPGAPAANSAGDPVDGLQEESSLVRLTYTNTQVLLPNFEQLLRYTNTCNDGSFLGANVYEVRMTGWSGDYDQKNNVWSISVEFVFNPDGWEIQYYDAGFTELVGVQRRAILDQVGNPVGQPVPLNGNGVQLPIGSEPIVRKLYPYPKVNMAQIFVDCRI